MNAELESIVNFDAENTEGVARFLGYFKSSILKPITRYNLGQELITELDTHFVYDADQILGINLVCQRLSEAVQLVVQQAFVLGEDLDMTCKRQGINRYNLDLELKSAFLCEIPYTDIVFIDSCVLYGVLDASQLVSEKEETRIQTREAMSCLLRTDILETSVDSLSLPATVKAQLYLSGIELVEDMFVCEGNEFHLSRKVSIDTAMMVYEALGHLGVSSEVFQCIR